MRPALLSGRRHPGQGQLIVNTPEKFGDLTGAMVYTEREVTALDPKEKKAAAKNLRTGAEEIYEYDACVIATGASPVVPPLPGMSLPGVFVMRTPDDAIEARDYLEKNGVKRAVVAGGGFIGLEVAENLLEKGVSVTVIDMADQIMPGFDREMADFAARHLEKKGIRVMASTSWREWPAAGERKGCRPTKGFSLRISLSSLWGFVPIPGFYREPASRCSRGRFWWTISWRPTSKACTRPETALW